MWIGVFVPVFVEINENCILSTDFSRNIQIYIYIFFWKSVKWEPSCSVRAGGLTDGRTDMTKLTVDFAISRKRLKQWQSVQVHASEIWKEPKFLCFFYLCVSRITVLMFPSTNYLWGAVSRKVRNKFWAEEMPE